MLAPLIINRRPGVAEGFPAKSGGMRGAGSGMLTDYHTILYGIVTQKHHGPAGADRADMKAFRTALGSRQSTVNDQRDSLQPTVDVRRSAFAALRALDVESSTSDVHPPLRVPESDVDCGQTRVSLAELLGESLHPTVGCVADRRK